MVPSDAPTPAGPPAKLAKGRNIIAVASGKGGVGKTWFSVTLCHALSREGQKVLLFDADLGLANVDIQLGLMPQRDLGGVLAGKLSLAQSRVRYEEGRFDIIAGRSGSGNLAQLPSNRLGTLGTDLIDLGRSYDSVIMDMGAGLDRTVRLLSGRAGRVLVVATAEPTSLTDAYAFIKVTLTNDPSADLRIVINAADTKGEGQRTYETLRKACANFLKAEPPLAGVIRRDRKVIEAIRTQTPIMIRHPGADAAHDVEAIANHLIENQ
ncbi:MinD/ParA family protein [Thalassobaculum sp.]|uniref:MinD/ParA family protein n=1 Tax=Thalassobaculum sp. TaxID=2022740 RepID=UPI0032EBEAE5